VILNKKRRKGMKEESDKVRWRRRKKNENSYIA
jgi:hypothetical protein